MSWPQTSSKLSASSRALRRCSLGALIVAASMGLSAHAAHADSLAVQTACMSDYFSHCSQHDPDSSGVRRCMRSAGPRLSRGCVSALIAAGEVAAPKPTRTAQRSTKSRKKHS